jgi:hypothetical protein
MENIFLLSGIIAVVFFVIKFIEMRFVEKEAKPLKILFRDTLIVYISAIFGFFLNSQLKPIIQNGGVVSSANPAVFTDNPSF